MSHRQWTITAWDRCEDAENALITIHTEIHEMKEHPLTVPILDNVAQITEEIDNVFGSENGEHDSGDEEHP